VVGIGASAGGLAALKTFFQQLGPDCGLAFVVVVHLSPEHKSLLADLLQPHVPFPVEQVVETTPLQVNHVYVIPPNANLSAVDSHLRVSELEEQRRERAPIDHFFRTLASTHDGHSVGVILTGSGSDGTLGLRDIKAKGGLIVVQDPNDAEFDGMPQSAIAAGLADIVLPVADIPHAILRYDRTTPEISRGVHGKLEDTTNALLPKIFTVLRSRTDRDFSRYKRSTILRRIARRMQLNYIENLEVYLERVREQPEEAKSLADDLLITVTSFFRDPEVFEKLERHIIPGIFDARDPRENVRVWSVGCATGEEAYSLAMLLVEEAARRDLPPCIQVFASDLHRRSLDRAREGFFPGDIETDVSPERLRRFFRRESGGYRIQKELRDLVVFAPHNLLGDPPFSRLDLITCRNLLIYLQREVQRDVIDLFHYALNPGGVLLLGSAETVEAADLFRVEDKKLCLYRKRNVQGPEPRLPVFPLKHGRTKADAEGLVIERTKEPVVYGALHQSLVEQYAPPSVLLGPDNRIVHLSEHAGRYLVHPGGELTSNAVKLVRDELRAELRTSIQMAREKKQVVDSKPIPVRFNGHARPVIMHVRPALSPEQDGYVLVIFNESEPQPDQKAPESSSLMSAVDMETIQHLESELHASRQRLQTIIEEYETSQEEMKASNEELQSTNEELRSTMEELETSKEELQSINEELQTLNQENRHKVEELSQLSSDLNNLLAATDIATLFLDRSLRILRFTPKLGELFNVRVTDRGRPISDLTHRLGYDELRSDAEGVLKRLIPVEREVQDETGHWYLTRVLAYRSTEDRIEGVVITFIDITTRKKAEDALQTSQGRLSVELDAMQRLHGLVTRVLVSPDLSAAMQDVLSAAMNLTEAPMGTIQLMNPTTRKLEMVAHHGLRKDSLDHLCRMGSDPASACGRALSGARRVVVEDVLNDSHYAPFRDEIEVAGYRAVQATPLISRNGSVMGILSTYHGESRTHSEGDLRFLDLYTRQAADLVERRRAEEELRRSEERYRLLIDSAREYAIFMLDPNGTVATWNPGAERLFGYSPEEIIGRSVAILFTPEDRAEGVPEAEMRIAAKDGRSSDDRWQTRKDGSRFWANGVTEALRDEGDDLSGFVKVLRDNTDRKEAEERLRDQDRVLRTVNGELLRANTDLNHFAFAASHDLREPLRMVTAFAEMLVKASREGRVDDVERASRFVVEGTRRMDQLLSDLLTYTRVHSDDSNAGDMVDLNEVFETYGRI